MLITLHHQVNPLLLQPVLPVTPVRRRVQKRQRAHLFRLLRDRHSGSQHRRQTLIEQPQRIRRRRPVNNRRIKLLQLRNMFMGRGQRNMRRRIALFERNQTGEQPAHNAAGRF